MSNIEILRGSASITYRFDSMSAICTSIGKWQAKSPRPIKFLAQSLWEAAVSVYPNTSVHHIKSRDGHPMNEFADSVCTAISEGNLSMDDFSSSLNFKVHADAMQWLFLPFLNKDAKLAYPLDLFYDPDVRRLGCSDMCSVEVSPTRKHSRRPRTC